MATILESLSNVVREDLTFMQRAIEPKVDGIFSRMYNTSEGVVRGGGRVTASSSDGWEVLHTFATGLSGAFKDLPGGGDAVAAAAATGAINMTTALASMATFPTIDETTWTGYVQRKIKLVEGVGNVCLPIHLMETQELDATIAKPVALTVKGTAKKIAQTEANNFYQSGGASKAVITLSDVSDAVTDLDAGTELHTARGVKISLDSPAAADSVGRIGRIQPGQIFTILQSDGSLLDSADPKYLVTEVDYVAKEFILVNTDGANFDLAGTGATQSAMADGDYLIPHGTRGASNVNYGPNGLHDWMKSTGSIFEIPVDLGGASSGFGQFKSVIDSTEQTLTDTVLNTKIGAFYDAYGDLCELDSAIATAGVLNKYIDNLDSVFGGGSAAASRFERQGQSMSVKGGWSKFSYEYNGRTFDLLMSRYCTDRHMYFIKTGEQNIKRYVPPRLPGAGSRDGFSQEIMFLGPLVGSNSIFMPAQNVDAALVKYLQAPFFCWRQVAPEQVQGVMFTNLNELF